MRDAIAETARWCGAILFICGTFVALGGALELFFRYCGPTILFLGQYIGVFGIGVCIVGVGYGIFYVGDWLSPYDPKAKIK